MNIYLINHYAGSPGYGMEYRPYYLAREWVRMGHRVRIIASSESHVRGQNPALQNKNKFEENIDGIEYTWLKTPSYIGNGIGRVLNMAAFIWHLFFLSKKLAGEFKPDVVIASSTYPMDIWPAHRIAKLAKAKLVFEVHDLWPLSPMELGGMSKWHPFIMLVQAAEHYAYCHANVVVSMLPKVRTYMESQGMAAHKLHIVPNGIDPDEWRVEGSALPIHIADKLTQLKLEGYAIVGYAGFHGLANALEMLLDVAKLMRDKKVVFVLVGNGPDKAGLQKRANAEKLLNVYFFDPVLKVQIPALLKWFDVAYIGWRKQPLYRFGIAPNKLMDYMMAARPILHAVEAGNDAVAEAGCGLTVQPENARAVVDGISRLIALNASELTAMGQRGRTFVLKNHSYSVLAQQFLGVLN